MAGWRDSAPRQPSEREGFEWVQRPDDGLWYELRVRGPSYLDDPSPPPAAPDLIPSQPQPTIDPQQQLTSPDQVPTGALDAFFSPIARTSLSDIPKLLASGTASLAREVATSPIPTPGTVQEAAMRLMGNVAQKVNPKANLDVVQQLGEQTQVRDAAFQSLQQDIQSSMSPQMQASLQKNWIDRDAEGNLTWGDADVATLLGQTAQSLPGVAAGIGAGGGAAQVLRAGTKGLFRRAGLERLARAGNTAAEARLKKIDAILDAAGYGLGETSVAAPLAEQQVRDQVNALDMATLRHSPRFMEIYDAAQELGPEERFLYARETLANELGSATGLKVAATTFAAGPIAGPVAGRARQLLTGRVAEAAAHATRGRAANAGVSALEEMGQEFVQSGAEGALQALALREAGVRGDQADPVLQAANQAVGGAAAGGLIGGGIGYATGRPGGAASATSPAPDAPAAGTAPGSPPGAPPPGGAPEAAAPVDEQVNMATLSALARQAQATEGIDVGAVQQITRAAVRKQITMPEAAQALRGLITDATGATPETDAGAAGAGQPQAGSEAAVEAEGAAAVAGAAQGEPQTAQQPSSIDAAANAAATSPTNGKAEPTEAQKEAGNYAKGHVRVQGLDISIENPRGSVRSGTNKDGRAWKTTMPDHYGYIRGTVGKDKDHIDVTLGPDPENASLPIFVFNQANLETGQFDEHKTFMGYADVDAARAAYRASFSGRLGQRMEKGLLGIAQFTPEQFKAWLADGAHGTPAQGPQGSAADLTPDEAAHSRYPNVAPETAERLAVPGVTEELRRMAPHAGWSETGGRMIRKSEDPDSPDYSTVVGRTKWLPHEPWFAGLPTKLGKDGDYVALVEKALAGEKLTAREQRVIEGMTEAAEQTVRANAISDADLVKLLRRRAEERAASVMSEADIQEYHAHLNDEERAQDEWFRRENESARGEESGPAPDDSGGQGPPAQPPAGEARRGDQADAGNVRRGGREEVPAKVTPRRPERPESQERLEFITGGKKGVEAEILVGRFADGRWGAVSNYQFHTGTMLGRGAPLDDRVPSMADTREEAINGAATILHNWMRGIASNQQADHTSAMREAATALADRLAKQYEIAAPPDAAPSPPVGKTPERDLFGEAPVSKQALADEQRRRDEKRNSGQDSTETGDPSDLFSQARQQTDLTETAAPKAAPRPSKNTIFTEDAAEAARAVLRKKLGQINTGIDPELLNAGITLAGYHIEKGARTFAAFAEAMIADLGEAVRPFLKSWYMAVKYDPRAKPFEKQMDSAGDVEAFDLHEADSAGRPTQTLSPYEQGKAAFLAGKPAAVPTEVITADQTLKAAKEWSRGWQEANLAAPVDTAPESSASETDDAAEAAAVGAAMDALVARLRGEGFKTIVEARKFLSELTGQPITDADLKYVDEIIETAVVAAARDIAGEGNDPARTFADLVDLYRKQPKLGTRTSTSVAQQAYSTPAPLAFLASRLAGVTSETSVYEPSAGNGMLLIEASPRNTHAVELNPYRAAALQAMGFNPVVGDAMSDATAPDHKQDVVIANPPFGVVRTDSGATRGFTVDVGGDFPSMQTNEIDHAISLHALSYLKDDGRAVLIIGGINKLARTEEARSDAYNGAAKRKFFYHLYRLYNVVDHFTVAGELYERQGAGWPVDVIVIHGRGKSSRDLPAADVPRVYSDWAAMAPLLESGDGQASGLGADAEGTGRVPRGGLVRPDSGAGSRSVSGPARGPDTGAGGRLSQSAGGGRAAAPESVGRGAVSGRGERATGVGGEPTGLEQSGDSRAAGSARGAARPGSEAGGNAGSANADRGGPGRSDGSARGVGRPDGKAPVASEGQSPYEPTSSADSVGTLVPSNMRSAIADSLSALVDRVGPLDEYVARELGYEPSSIGKYFSGEQVDALALALDQMQRGAGFIIGDQTGVGKGRVVAGVIRYALKNGHTPIFVTEKPNLYADMYRDLTDIGMQDIRPLMTNAGEKVPLDDDGKVVLKTPAGKAHSQALEEMASTGDLGAHNIVFTTYSQMQTLKGAETSRMAFLRAIAPNAIVIFDESHNAGGNDSARKNQRQMEVDAGSKKTGRAAFARALAGLASGVFYSSATYAKRPSVMDLYFKTDMRMAVGGNVEALPDAIQAGGVPLQQVVASMLARAGQYIRRERSFEGVEYNTAETTVDRPAAERISAIMLSVKEFDDAKKEAVKALAQAAKREAKQISGDGVTGAAGAESTNFTSIMHNAIDQMLLGLKAERAAELAIEALKRGEKPVITVANTMGSFIEEYAEAAGMKSGDAINLTFGDLLARYLERSRDVRIKSPDGTSSRHRMSDEELGPFALSAYRAAEALVRGAGEIASMPVSPIDWIHARIQAAGYTSGEITGRTHTIDYSSAGGRPIYRSRGSKATSIFGRRKTITDFNSGKLDVVVLNQAGATGLSLHASEKFKDKRRRRMIIAQAEKNIDTHMQMLGRVHRTGQVVAPAYDQLVADVPAEKRPAAVLAKKMASLNANTTASRTSAVTSKDTVDFLNQYGDEVVAQLMADLPDVHRRLGEPLDNDSEGFVTEDAARKVTGRIPLLPVAEQEELYDMIESGYREAIARADAMGENALEAKTLELDAKTTERRTLFEREGDSNSPFADAAYLETVDAKRLGKPYTSEQVRELAAGEAGLGKDAAWDDIKDAAAEKWRRTASDTRDSFQQYRAGLEKAMFDAGTKDVVARARLGVLDGQFDRWKGLADTLTPGETYELQLKNGAVFYGVLLDITRKKGVKMPVANGSWVARFAVADGARQIALPFSKLTTSREDAARPEARVTYVEARAEHPLLGSILKMFDAGQSTSRENRHIVTGNLLAGFSKLPRGQIVHYTDDTGATRQGVLLPRNFDIKEFEAAQPIELAPAAAMKLLKSHPQARVETADGSVRLLADGDGFLLSTPRSKSGGGDVYLDPQVRAITGDFVSVANSMRAGITAEQARRVLPILAEKFGPLQAESHRKEALAAGGRRAIGNVVPPDSTGTTEVRENAAVYEGEAAKDPKVRARRRKVAASRPAKAGRGNVQPAGPVQIDIFANDALPLQGQQAARTFDRVALVETGRFKTGITTVDDWTAAAHILAPLRKSAQEQFLMLALDKRRRPLAVLRHTVGLRDSSNVDPGTVFGHIASVPNVAKVYFAHNHPSGVIEQSEADHLITDHLNALMRGSGIEVGGMIVVAPGSRKASLYTPGSFGDMDLRIQPAVRKESVPMLERRLTRIQPGKFMVRSQADGKEAVKQFASGIDSGLLLVSGRLHVVGVLPLSVAEMGRLRTDDPRTSHARLFAEAGKVNASGAIAFVPNTDEAVNAARNALTALAAGNIRDLDIVKRAENGTLTQEAGRRNLTNDAFYSRAGNLAFVSEVMRQLGRVDDLFKNPPSAPTSLIDVFADIPGYLPPENDTDPDAEPGVQRNVTHFTRRIEGGGTDRVPVHIYQRGRDVWIDVSRLRRGEGGDRIYQGIADYARATGRRFIGDPAGLSPDASVRRTYHMLSNLLRYGDLKGFEPAREQLEGNAKAGIPPLAWPADNEGRLRSLIKTFYGTLRADFPGITNYGYDFRTGAYTDRRGEPLSPDARRSLVRSGDRAIPYGVRALRAGIFLQSLARLESEARPGILAEVLRDPERVVQRSKALFTRDGVASGTDRTGVSQVEEWLSQAVEKTRGAAETVVVADVAALREATGDPSIPDDVEGVYFDGESRIYLVASALPTREEALRKYTHEMFGHLALEQYGDIDRAVRMVRNMRRMGSKSIGALWQEVALTQPGLDPVRHAKEVIALMAERGVKNSMIDRLLAWARDLLRSWGIDIEYSDAEVRALIARAARALQEAARVSGADRVRAAKIDAAATEEAALRQLNAMDLADSPLIGSGAPLDAYYTRPAVLDKETLGETDIEALDDAIAAALFETPGPDRERLYSRRAPEDPEITRIRRHVMANAAHEGLPLKDRMRLFITRVTDISGLAMRQAIVNKFQSIAAYERLMNAGKLLDAALSPYKQTVATQNLGSVMSAILHKGIPAWVNGAYTVANDGRKGILEIFAPLVNHPDGNLLPQWELYAAARRASRLIEEGRERLFTQEMIDRSLELEQKYPIFKDVFDDWQTFNTQTLDMAQEAGLIDPEARAIWERHDYVPFYRAMESVSGRVNAVSLKKSIANQRARIRTLFGGTSPLEDVFESMLMNTAHLVDASFKNRAAQAIVTAFDGVATTRLPKVVQPTTISADQAMRALRAAGVNLVGQEPSSDYLTLFRRVAPVGKNIVSVMFDGKPQYFEVHDPLLLQSIVEMSPNEWLRQIDLFTFGLLSGSKRLLTRAVTAMPGFIMANYLRDTASNVVQNQNKSVGDMLKLTFITESLKGAVAYIADNPVVAEMMMSGAGGDQVYDNERGNLKRTLMREMSDSAARTRLEEIAGTMVSPRRLWKVYTKVQQASENANRIATYRLVRERGGTHAEAAYQAHDVLNFQQRGAHPAMQLLVMMVPFLNARIQGLDRLARGFTANRMGFMFKGLMLTAVTIALMGLGDDDERYRELPQWDRDANWHLFLGKLHLRIPKPFEVGALFGTVPERMIRLMRGQDRFRDVAQSLVRMVTDTFAFNPVPQAFKPVLEAWAGRSFFTNRPILSIAERNLLPEAQYRPWTSPTLISIAQAMPDAAPAFMRSPLQLEHLIRGYLGGMGMMALEVADRSVRAAGGYYDAPSQSPVDVMLRRFARTGEPRVTRWHDELYRMMDAADEAARTVSKLQGERLFEQAREVAKENRQALLLRPKLNHLAKRMRELNAQLRRVQGSRTLTGDQKRAEIERLNAARNDIARQVEPYAGLF